MTDSKCPLCNEIDSIFITKYPGIFLHCIELHQCQACDLIYCVELPTKEELLSKFVGGLNYPMNTLASTLNSLIPKVLTALTEINKQKK